MSDGTRIPLAEAQALAAEVVEFLAPYCTQIAVAGSIRRERPTIGDIEIVCLPLYSDPPVDLFGEPTGDRPNQLDARCDWLFEQGVLGKRFDRNGRPRWGSGLKWATYRDFPLDLFPVVAPAQYGVDLLIRTGSAAFSHRFVTPRRQGGWMPDGWHVLRGALWRHGEMLDSPTEASVFEAIGRPYIEPQDREV